MKRALLILCFLLPFLFLNELSANSAPFFPPLQPVDATSVPVENYSNNITSAADSFVTPNNFNVTAVNRIEQSLFGRSFANQNVVSRLSRIEKSLFNTTYPSASTTQRLDNIISNFNQLNKYPNISRNTLSKIESKVFSQSFPQNSTERRVERLEQQVFGAVQSGDINQRYKNLMVASKAVNPDAVINSYYPTPASGPRLRNVLGNFGNTMMGGNMTGFTPPIDSGSTYSTNNSPPYNTNAGYNTNPAYNTSPGYNTNTGYNNTNMGYNSPFTSFGPGSGSGIYKGYGTSNGLGGYSYGESSNNYGTGTGVHILD